MCPQRRHKNRKTEAKERGDKRYRQESEGER